MKVRYDEVLGARTPWPQPAKPPTSSPGSRSTFHGNAGIMISPRVRQRRWCGLGRPEGRPRERCSRSPIRRDDGDRFISRHPNGLADQRLTPELHHQALRLRANQATISITGRGRGFLGIRITSELNPSR
jgi:hypothetical protein